MADVTVVQARNSGKAMASLICGILGFVGCGIVTAVPAIILGTQAIQDVDDSGGEVTGRGQASAGRILGIINVVVTLVSLLGLFLFLLVVDRSTDGPPVAISQGAGVQRVAVDNVVSQRFEEAEDLLISKGLVVTRVDQPNDSVPAGTVLGQEPAAGSEVDAGSPVRLVVAASTGLVAVPAVVNKRGEEASRALVEGGLVPDVMLVTNPGSMGIVFEQNPAAGAKVTPGSKVTVKVSAGAAPMVPPQPTTPMTRPPSPPVTPVMTAVPSVIGRKEADARRELEAVGFAVRAESGSGAPGVVTRQFPSAGMQLPAGSTVTIFVGATSDPTTTVTTTTTTTG